MWLKDKIWSPFSSALEVILGGTEHFWLRYGHIFISSIDLEFIRAHNPCYIHTVLEKSNVVENVVAFIDGNVTGVFILKFKEQQRIVRND